MNVAFLNNKSNNIGKKWTEDEELLLLNELKDNIPIHLIAEQHKRTNNGIKCRCKELAYRMYIDNISIEKIKETTKLSHYDIEHIIKKKEK